MAIDLRLPNITATTPEGQIAQIKSSLIQLTQQLNVAFNSISDGESMSSYAKRMEEEAESKEVEKNNTFSEIKALIIKSADVVEHICDEVETIFDQNEKYVASSTFGTYKEEQQAKMEALPNVLKTSFYTKQEVEDKYGARLAALESNALIKQGVLRSFTAGQYEGVPQYGIEIGQEVVDKDGKVVYNKMARLFSEGVELYKSTDDEKATAIFKYDTMYITKAEIAKELKLGGYELGTDEGKGLSFRWVGR